MFKKIQNTVGLSDFRYLLHNLFKFGNNNPKGLNLLNRAAVHRKAIRTLIL